MTQYFGVKNISSCSILDHVESFGIRRESLVETDWPIFVVDSVAVEIFVVNSTGLDFDSTAEVCLQNNTSCATYTLHKPITCDT